MPDLAMFGNSMIKSTSLTMEIQRNYTTVDDPSS